MVVPGSSFGAEGCGCRLCQEMPSGLSIYGKLRGGFPASIYLMKPLKVVSGEGGGADRAQLGVQGGVLIHALGAGQLTL